MTRKYFLSLVLLLFALCGRAQKTIEGATQHRIVMQLSSNDTLVWKGLMNNLKNLKAGWGDSVLIEVVAHGPGIDFLTKGKTTQQEKINYFKQMGISFVACENTMTERKVPKDAIVDGASFVKMGIGEIIRKQEEGWSYIKAGF